MKKVLINICIIFLLLICIYSSIKAFQKYQTKEEIKKINHITDTPDNSSIDFLRNEYGNDDIVGILKIASINTIVVQGKDNDYYLNHLVNHEENKTGSVFMDYRQDIDDAKQLNIFGHSSDYYDLPFNTLLNYSDMDFYKKNNIAELITEKNTYKYEIIGVKITSNEEHLKFEYNNENDYKEHLRILLEDNLYNTDVQIDESDKILIIQTCTINDEKGNLLIIILRKVGEE